MQKVQRQSLLLAGLCGAGFACFGLAALPSAPAEPESSISAPAPIPHAVVHVHHPWDGRRPSAQSRDENWAVVRAAGQWKLWNIDRKAPRALKSPKFEVESALFAADGRQLFLTGKGGVAIYSVPSGRRVHQFRGAELLGDARFIVYRTNSALRFWDAASAEPLATVAAHPDPYLRETLDFSPNGRLVAAGQSGQMWVWDLKTGQLVSTLSDSRGVFPQDGVTSPAVWTSDSKTLVTGGEDPQATPAPPGDGTQQVDTSPSLDTHPYAVKVWDVKTGALLSVWPGFGSNSEGVPLFGFVTPREVELRGDDTRILNIDTGETREG